MHYSHKRNQPRIRVGGALQSMLDVLDNRYGTRKKMELGSFVHSKIRLSKLNGGAKA